MQISLNTDAPVERSLRNVLPLIRDVGFEAVDMTWPPVASGSDVNRDPSEELGALLAESGLKLAGLGVGAFTAIEEGALPEAVAACRERMRWARESGLRSVSLRAGDRGRQSWELLYRGLKALLADAEASGLTILLANAYGTRIEQLDDLRRVFIELDDPHLGVLLDAGQFHSAAVNPRDALAELWHRVRFVRLGDRIGRRPVPLGRGETNVPAIIEDLHRRGYDGPLSVELPPHEPGELEALLCNTHHDLHRMLQTDR